MSEKKLIAIVDDHVLFRKSLAILIEMFPGYKVLFDVSDGKALIANLSLDQLPQIVLMDINMPVMDGYVTTAWLRVNHPSIKVLALSTMDSETAIIRMIKSGAKGYILKDANPEELRRALDEVMARGYFYNEIISRKIMNTVTQLTINNNNVSLFAKFSEKEVEFLKLVCTELTYKEIADKLFVSVRTVEGYRDTLCQKLELKTRVGLVIYAIKNGIVNP